MADSFLSTHILTERTFFFLLQKVASHPNLSALLLLPCTNTDRLSATIPKSTTTPRPSRWASLGFLLQLMPGSVQLRVNSLQGSSEWQSVKVNNNTWHCCVTVKYFHLAPYGNMSDFTASPADMSVLLAGVHCHCSCVSVWSWDAEKCHLPLASPGRGATSHSLQRELGMLSASLDQAL